MNEIINFNDYVYEPIDLCALYEPIIFPPAELVAEWEQYWKKRNTPFHETVRRKIGNTWYLIETVCDGDEPLADKTRRLIFSDREAICS